MPSSTKTVYQYSPANFTLPPLTQKSVQARKLWNLGATTLLIVERRSQVQVFSTFSKPAKEDNQGQEAQIKAETIDRLETAELALRLQQLIRRIETGAIYRDYTPLFNPKDTVDQLLLDNLKVTRNLLSPVRSRDGYRRAHALIGKFLFSCYLLDRGIIGPPYLKKNGLPEASDMLGMLPTASVDAARTLDKLFQVLQRDFNGSLFGNQSDSPVIDIEVECLRRFLSGDVRTGQMLLFRLYDFSFIPVELISAIYQEFVNAEAEAEAQPTQKNQPRNDGQRTQGAYYTPPRLAELTVDIATEGWDTLLDKRCLDPACGSGVFLVILFVRMAEEWRKRNPRANTRRRYDELMRFLSENLRGVDIHATACLVTCFSLYLAFLDQMEPKEIMELREALEQDTKEKLLPRILWERGKPRPRSPQMDSIRELDFFELPTKPEFDLVIGNPPWVSRKSAPSAEAWLFSEKQNPAADGLKKSERNQTLFPAKELACAFMWKAGLHLRNAGRVCQVLPSRVFLSNNTDSFQAAWLQHHRLESVWLLADYRWVLFPGAVCPCFIGRYHPRPDNEPLSEFAFITPKVELLDPREAMIPVQSEDQKVLKEADIIAAAVRTEAASAWKQHHWGTPRDERLIARLMAMPRLSRLAKEPPKDPDSVSPHRKRHWFKGQGFQPATGSTQVPDKVFWDVDDLFISAGAPVDDLVLLRTNCDKIGKRYSSGLHRKRSPLLYKSPLLLINQACTKFLFSDFDVLFQHDFQSICAPKHEETELLFLTAVLASPLTQYLLFHTTANIGIERDKALLEEILALPFPLPEDMPNKDHCQAVIGECAALLRDLKRELLKPQNLLKRTTLVQQAKRKLNKLVYDYFGVCGWERHLIEDTVSVFRPSSTPTSLDSEKLFTAHAAKPDDRKAYASTLVSTFRGWTRTKASLWTRSCIAPKLGLAFVTFGVGGRAKAYRESQAEKQVEELLDRIRKSSTHSVGTVRYLRGFAFYEGTTVHLLKPLSRRYWTRTAALNDADEILSHMMKEEGWGD
ncbi:MAG: Eco57I restriction-modification methylase domain-containing protein [Pirellulales bacterium]